MSILAEPRRKQKISVDPQNLTWKNDDQKFSKKLMEKMGWNEGDGLGKSRQGNADAVKLKANYSGKGLGADKMNDYDSTWISHHDDFADLLAALNKNKEQEPEQTEEEKTAAAEKISIELKSKSIRRRIHYQKFTRAKDTSNYSDGHKKGILGYGRLKKDKEAGEKNEEKEEKKDESSESQDSGDDKKEGNNTVSTLSVGDYFAAKMAALKAKREAAANNVEVKIEIKEEVIEETEETEEERAQRKAEKKERKRLRREQREKERLEAENGENEVEIKQEIKEEEPEEIDEAERKRLKKEKKRLKRLHEQQQMDESGNGNAEEGEEEVPKKRKKMTAEDH